jgi:phage tail protein X
MIEIVCEKGKGEAADNAGRSDAFKMPKNLRQVGNPPASNRIYIEDYVVTYLNYIARPGSTEVRGAVLVGEKKTTEQGDAVFISGAVDAQNIEFDMNECRFTEEIWSEIYEEIKDYFPDLTVVGWFLSRMGFSTAINDRIEKLHIDNFPGSDKVLYVTDSLESEDAFYVYERGQMVRQKGYYIYYAKNEQMKNYIISKRGEENTEEKNDIRRKDSELLKSYREKNKQLQEERENSVGLGYVAGGFLALAVLAMGVTIAGNYKKMQNMEVSINRLELTSDATETNTAAAATIITPEELVKADEEASISIKGETDGGNVQTGEKNNADGDGQAVSGGEYGTADDAMAASAASGNNQIEDNISEGLEGQVVDAADDTAENSVGGIQTAETADSDAKEENSDASQEASSSGSINVTTVGDKVMYRVKHGDTLTSIALAYYGSISYVDDIATANSIGEEYIIYEGENIFLPNID